MSEPKSSPLRETLRRRSATTLGALAIGLVALAFAAVSDVAQQVFRSVSGTIGPAVLVLTPAGFVLLAWLTRKYVPAAKGSGIPQAMAAAHGDTPHLSPLISIRTAVAKFVLTIAGLGLGASSGREGPTVQISAAVMTATHRLFRVPLTSAVVIAGSAAGVSAAFNTPLAGIAFAIEELAAAYEQRLALLTMAAVMIAGLVSLGLAGDYLYFGAHQGSMSIAQGLVAVPVLAAAGGAAGALFSRIVLGFANGGAALFRLCRAHPLWLAAGCGLVVAVLGFGTGLTWGTGYEPAKLLIEGAAQPIWFAPAKFLASIATAVSGIPGGIFAPSLSVGAGLGGMLAPLFAGTASGNIVLLAMTAYFVGVVRAPLTAVIIIMEMTASHDMLIALFATAVIAEGTARLICPVRLYHGLSKAFMPSSSPST